MAYESANLVFARNAAGLTLAKLAEKSRMSKATIINYEKGRRVPRIDDLEKIATALGCSINDLLNPPQPSPQRENLTGQLGRATEQVA